MLRYGFLPSDFHPQFLILGERSELATFVEILRSFAKAPDRTAVAQRPPRAPERWARLILVPTSTTTGLVAVVGEPATFEWRLESEAAAMFADMIEMMIADPAPSGSEYLEAGCPGEIPIKVSHGEYTDQFLIDDF